MKKLIVIGSMLLMSVLGMAQKFAYVDTEYILGNIPAYKEAQEQLNKLSAQWQKEIETEYTDIDKLYKQFQVDKLLLSEEMKNKREQEIMQKEKEVKQLQKKRFGPEGDRYKKEQELIKPIQDEVFNAVKDIASSGGYGIIFDASSSSLTMLYTDSKYDISDDILKKMGYVK